MSLACGGAAGLISSTVTFPLDLIRRRMQLEGQGGLRRYRGYADVARAVFRSGGLKGFYAGIIPEYYKVGLVMHCRRALVAASADHVCVTLRLPQLSALAPSLKAKTQALSGCCAPEHMGNISRQIVLSQLAIEQCAGMSVLTGLFSVQVIPGVSCAYMT